MTTLSQIIDHKIVAIIRGIPADDVIKIVAALYDGGIKIVEVTLNSQGALQVIEKLNSIYKNKMLIGAGTVLDKADAKAAIGAGAQFLISPVTVIEVIRAAKDAGIVSIPGAYTATEILLAHKSGADIVKVFPAQDAVYVKNILAPLNHILLMPTGGINLTNIKAFKAAGATAYGAGSALVDNKIKVNKLYLQNLTAKARSFIQAIQ